MSTVRPSRRAALPLAAALFVIAAALAGCSSVVDFIPTKAGGLPTTVPARPEEAVAYPAVGDAPRGRDAAALTQDEEKRLREELTTLRDKQGEIAGITPPKKDAAPA